MGVDRYPLFINGTWQESQSEATFESLDPATNEPIAEVAQGGKADIDAAVDAAREAADGKEWGQLDGPPAGAS